jgi:hypothetical protein
VRVIAARLPPEQQGAAQRRFRARAKRKGRQASERGELLASWLVVVTTLDAAAWKPAEVLALYRVRWQVELRIKRVKQLLTSSRLRARTAASGEALLWAQLVGWALHEPTAAELRAPVLASGRRWEQPLRQEEVSGWQLSVLVLETLRQAVRGSWDQERVIACLPELRRYLVQWRRRERVQQETAALEWLKGLAPPPPGWAPHYASLPGYS